MCDCKVGPGKFEGEGALMALAYSSLMLGGSDATTGDCGSLVDWFRRPFNFDADRENLLFAREMGYCETCIAEALKDEAYGLALSEDSNGFVYLESFETAEAFDKALGEAQTTEEGEENV